MMASERAAEIKATDLLYDVMAKIASGSHKLLLVESDTQQDRPGGQGATGDSADRERYVTDRANFIAKAFLASYVQPTALINVENDITRVFRDLIDRGVLK